MPVLDTKRVLSGFLNELSSLGRSSRFDLCRHAALRGEEHMRAAAAVRGATPAADARRARLSRLAGRDDEAARLWESALARRPELPEALAGRWEQQVSSGRADAGALDRAIAQEPRAEWRAWRGLRRLLTGRDASADLRSAAAAGGAVAVVARVARARACLRSGAPQRALRELDAAVALGPREGWLRRLRAKARWQAGDEPGFLADFEAETLLDEGIGTLAYPFGERAVKFQAVLAGHLDKELRRRPGVWWLLAARGDARRAPEVDDLRGGLDDLEEALRLSPRSTWLWGHIARARQALGRAADAAAAADAGVQAHPRCGWLRAWRGALSAKTGDHAAAVADFDAARALDPDYDLVYLWRGRALHALGRTDEAIADLDLTVRLTPWRRIAWSLRAGLLREAGRVSEAEESERRAGPGGHSREIEALHRSAAASPRAGVPVEW